VCTLRCRRHYFMAFGELTHADRIAARIVELNGEPDLNPRRQMLSYLGARDRVTRRLMEEILASEQGHVEDLASLLRDVSSGAGHSARA
jgi:bacterioferritin